MDNAKSLTLNKFRECGLPEAYYDRIYNEEESFRLIHDDLQIAMSRLVSAGTEMANIWLNQPDNETFFKVCEGHRISRRVVASAMITAVENSPLKLPGFDKSSNTHRLYEFHLPESQQADLFQDGQFDNALKSNSELVNMNGKLLKERDVLKAQLQTTRFRSEEMSKDNLNLKSQLLQAKNGIMRWSPLTGDQQALAREMKNIVERFELLCNNMVTKLKVKPPVDPLLSGAISETLGYLSMRLQEKSAVVLSYIGLAQPIEVDQLSRAADHEWTSANTMLNIIENQE